MNSKSRLIHWLVWGFLAWVVLAVAGVFVSSLLRQKSAPLPVLGSIPEFSLTNQFNQVVGRSDLNGSVAVANIIFTRCTGPCWQMTRTMKAIQDRLPDQSRVTLVSLTADPEFDTPSVLRQYGERFEADLNHWHFLTGPRAEVYGLAMNGLKLAVQENTGGRPNEDQFIHSTRMVLIDRSGQLRGVAFDGTEPEVVAQVINAVKELLKES